MDLDVSVTELGHVLGGWTVNVVGGLLSKHSRMKCVRPNGSSYADEVVKASRADHDRWHAATNHFLLTIRALQKREEAISLHQRPPFHGRLLWHIKYARRNWLLRKGYDEAAEQLRADFTAALATFLKDAGDIPEYVEAYTKRERERLRREQEQARQRRATAIQDASGPVWSYRISKSGGSRSFWIYLTTLESGGNGEHTPPEVQAALAKERAKHRYTKVNWGPETSLALEEKYQTEVSGWARLTGEMIVAHPIDPNDRSSRQYSKYHSGPSSNYGSDGGAGGFAGGGF
ncbi:hypothetical protein NLX83_26775 [Allokutzneria sp. A3M-2-11 16]|uniref:hypothetical protein n=1 Tax=Allokutzneria sp. A3M-2-11 16 TaxID=2962043 RepID=UPI0020B8DD23|nr:hypothetical protein [Allokutzneria sp. A3M-2-11 16]MCP3802885.1 hypothetical protein [Allokutzneria sp. A3M-2-11 16]